MCQKGQGRRPTQGGCQRRNAEGLLGRRGKGAPPAGTAEAETPDCDPGLRPRRRRMKPKDPKVEAARGFRNQIPMGMKEPSPASHVHCHLVPQLFRDVCLNHLATLLITCPSVTDGFLHVDGSYLLLTGFGGFLCDQRESQVLNEYFSS